jgi:small subunit ribosomal protein S1
MAYKRTISETDQGSLDFEKMLNESLDKKERKLNVGDRIKAEVLSVGKERVIVTTGTRLDGYVQAQQLQDEAGVSKVKPGDHVDLFVTYLKGNEVFLSPNATSQNIAEDLQEAFTNDQPIEGKVDSVNKGGFQVTINGKQAFCPLSQMDLKRIEKPEEYIGLKFTFKITQVGEGGRNIVVSRRKVLEEGQGAALAAFKDQRKAGDVITGTVKRLEPFGAFIEIQPGLEGLAHVSELAWTRVSNPADIVQVGQVVKATILSITHEERRTKISLTLKTAEGNPWANLPETLKQGRVISAKVTRLMPFGAFAEVAPGIEGLIPLGEMSREKRIASASEVVKEGETVTVLVKNVDAMAKRISLSIKDAVEAAASASEAEDIRDYAAKQASQGSFGASGDMAAKLQAAMARAKK